MRLDPWFWGGHLHRPGPEFRPSLPLDSVPLVPNRGNLFPIHLAFWSTADDVGPRWWDTRGPPRRTVRTLVNCKSCRPNLQLLQLTKVRTVRRGGPRLT